MKFGIGRHLRRVLPLLYLGLNLGCALAAVLAAHRVAALTAAEHRTATDAVDGITFFATSAPALVLAMLANLAWGTRALAAAVRRRSGGAFAWLGAAALVWAVALLGARLA